MSDKQQRNSQKILGNQTSSPLGRLGEESTGEESTGGEPTFSFHQTFRFCPRCGSAHFVENDFKSMRCMDCGFVYYLNPSSANAAFILNDKEQLLVIHRKEEPQKGKLDLPGGFCDIGESIEEGVAREVKEEMGLDVVESRFLFSFPNNYMYSGFIVPTLDAFFLCRVKNASSVHAGDDAADYLWMDLKDVDPSQFAFDSTRHATSKFLLNLPEYLKK